MIEHRGFIGHFVFDDQSNLFIGRVVNTNDLITFQGNSVSDVKEAFRDAVEDYINWCKKYRNVPAEIENSERHS